MVGTNSRLTPTKRGRSEERGEDTGVLQERYSVEC